MCSKRKEMGADSSPMARTHSGAHAGERSIPESRFNYMRGAIGIRDAFRLFHPIVWFRGGRPMKEPIRRPINPSSRLPNERLLATDVHANGLCLPKHAGYTISLIRD